MTKDYLLDIRVKNNYLANMMKEHGFYTVAALSRATGVSQQSIGHLLNLTVPGQKTNGKWRPTLTKLAEFFGCIPENLIPEQHQIAPLRTARITKEFDLIDLQKLIEQPKRADEILALEESNTQLKHIMNEVLTDRERTMISLGYGLDGDTASLTEIGDMYGVSKERVRQIQFKSMRKIRQKFAFVEDVSWDKLDNSTEWKWHFKDGMKELVDNLTGGVKNEVKEVKRNRWGGRQI